MSDGHLIYVSTNPHLFKVRIDPLNAYGVHVLTCVYFEMCVFRKILGANRYTRTHAHTHTRTHLHPTPETICDYVCRCVLYIYVCVRDCDCKHTLYMYV